MSIIRKMRKQTAVVWSRSTTPDKFGQYTFAEPIEIACRWEQKGKEFRDESGQIDISESVVYVDRELKFGDRLKLGELESDMTSNPFDFEGTAEIRRFEALPNLRATETLYIAYLTTRYA